MTQLDGERTDSLQRTTEAIIWDSAFPATITEYAWPTYSADFLYLGEKVNLSGLFRLLKPLGYHIVEIVEYQYGFLWLRKGSRVVMEREMEWVREGTEKRFVGSRKTPSLAKTLFDDSRLTDYQMAELWDLYGDY